MIMGAQVPVFKAILLSISARNDILYNQFGQQQHNHSLSNLRARGVES